MNIVSISVGHFWPSYREKGTKLESEMGSEITASAVKNANIMNFKSCGVKKRLLVESVEDLSSFSTDSSGQLDVLWHDGDPLGVNCTQICVFEESHEVGFRSFLQGHDGRTLETQIGFEILSNFSN